MLNRVSCVVVVILALAVPANGQVANAEVNGTAVDQTGTVSNRRSRFVGTPTVADEPRTMQLGVRYTF